MARMRLGILALAAVFAVVSACGGGPTRVGPTDSPATAQGQVTETDAGKTITVRVGGTLEVVLRAEQDFTDWSHPVSSNAGVLAPTVDTKAAAPRGVTIAAFKGVAPGTAQVQAETHAACSPGQVCSQLARAWTVTVKVS